MRAVRVVTRLVLDEIVDAFGARVIVERDDDGRARAARFDLTGLPRLDGLLVGRPVLGVPALVERLCGICPAAHHLAGVRALEALGGASTPTPTADAVRRLLHHGSGVATHVPRLLAVDRDGALELRRFARAAIVAAGSPDHFPTTAVPGGVSGPVSREARDALADRTSAAVEAATRIARRLLAEGVPSGPLAEPFSGADAALADGSGRPDLLGERLRVVAADGTVVETAAPPSRWDEIVAESEPGSPAPRPYLLALGPDVGLYRVGPVAQLRIGPLTTPVAASLQAEWLAAGHRTGAHGGAGAARAIMTVHSVEAVGMLLDEDALLGGPLVTSTGLDARWGVGAHPGDGAHPGVGVGWVDGPRGLLVHRYAASREGTVTSATILTPTAQNERWLAGLLRIAADAAPFGANELDMEDAIREADPCLPCSSAPAGAMGLRVETVTAGTPQTRSR